MARFKGTKPLVPLIHFPPEVFVGRLAAFTEVQHAHSMKPQPSCADLISLQAFTGRDEQVDCEM